MNEFQLPNSMWKSTLPLVQGSLNNTILKRLNDNCPLTIFTGHPQDFPVPAIVSSNGKTTQVHNIDEARLKSICSVSKLHASIKDMHRSVRESTSLRREQATASYNSRTGVRPVNFTTGDFVLKARATRGKKLQLTWSGPYRVVKCRSEYLFEVEDMITKQRRTVHGRRLKKFGTQILKSKKMYWSISNTKKVNFW